MSIRAVIFDRGGVLTDFDVKAAIAFFEPLLPLSMEELVQRWEQWGKLVGFPRSVTEENAFFHGLWNHLSDEFGLSQAKRKQLLQFNYTSLIRPFPDARPMLLDARRRGLLIGVLSNFSLASLDASLVAAGLADLVDIAYAATVIGVAKPHPESYLTLTDALSVEPKECLLFDDEMPCVKGGRAVGIHSYFVDRRRSRHAISQGVVCDLSALPTILAPPQNLAPIK
ncbi:MAG: HAD family hydrolase [Ardenticatenaceae bacterium]